jgi:hypothetical protein
MNNQLTKYMKTINQLPFLNDAEEKIKIIMEDCGNIIDKLEESKDQIEIDNSDIQEKLNQYSEIYLSLDNSINTIQLLQSEIIEYMDKNLNK